MQDTLSQQLASRARRFCDNVGISQRRLAKWLKVEESHLSKFLSGKANLNSECTLALVRLMGMNRAQLEAKFSKPQRATITHFQEKGRPMKLSNDGWVAREGSTDDPNNTSDISNTWKKGGEPSGDDIIDVLREVQNLQDTPDRQNPPHES
jgi:transcriptional regulator with XRE-family HTH domain